MSSRRQISNPLGGRYRQVPLYRAMDWWWVMVTSWHGNTLRITSIFLAQQAGVSSTVSLHKLLNKGRVTGDGRLYDSHVRAQYLNITSHLGIYFLYKCHRYCYRSCEWLKRCYLENHFSVHSLCEFTALSKGLPATYPLVRTIVHGVGLIIMIGWPHLLCRTCLIPPCHFGIQKLHIHRKYPTGSGMYSHTLNHFLAASHQQRSPRSTASTLFTVPSSQGHVNHVITIMALLSFTEFWNLYCPRTIQFS